MTDEYLAYAGSIKDAIEILLYSDDLEEMERWKSSATNIKKSGELSGKTELVDRFLDMLSDDGFIRQPHLIRYHMIASLIINHTSTCGLQKIEKKLGIDIEEAELVGIMSMLKFFIQEYLYSEHLEETEFKETIKFVIDPIRETLPIKLVDFLLGITGSWVISMRPKSRYELAADMIIEYLYGSILKTSNGEYLMVA